MKALESSTVVAFRVLVMLTCLIVAPMAAIFGSAFPEVVKTAVDKIIALAKPPGDAASGAEAPPFAAVTPISLAQPATAEPTPRWNQPVAPAMVAGPPSTGLPPNQPTGPGEAPPVWGQNINPSSASLPATNPAQAAAFAAPVEPAGARPISGAAFSAPAREIGGAQSPPYGTVPVPGAGQIGGPVSTPGGPSLAMPGDTGGAGRRHPGYIDPADPAAARPLPATQPERFSALEKRLREAGASYYLLETWGTQGELYRFHCRVSIANNPNWTNHFEATDANALTAMTRVLEQIEAWRNMPAGARNAR